MKKYYRLVLVVSCCASVVALLVYRHQYNRLRYVLEVLEFFGEPNRASRPETEAEAAAVAAGIGVDDPPPTFQRIDDDHFAYSSFWRNGASHTLVLGSERASRDFGCEFAIENERDPAPGAFTYAYARAGSTSKRTSEYVALVFHCEPATNSGTPFAVAFYPNPNRARASLVRMVDVDVNDTAKTVPADRSLGAIAACVVPSSFRFVTERNVFEFLSFHKLIGISEFRVYDNSLPFRVLEKLRTLRVDAFGYALKFVPFEFPFPSEHAYDATRDLAESDCAFRNLYGNRRLGLSNERISHVVGLAWDEFVVPRYHRSLKPLLTDRELGRTIELRLPTLHFCVNQRNDPKVNDEYPNVVKKTHYDRTMTNKRARYVYSIGSTAANDIALLSRSNRNRVDSHKIETVSQEIVAIHKYIDCTRNRFGQRSEGTAADFNRFETRPHRFEGAMLRFADDLYNSQLYRLYRTDVAAV